VVAGLATALVAMGLAVGWWHAAFSLIIMLAVRMAYALFRL
jgi:hypothetical protein